MDVPLAVLDFYRPIGEIRSMRKMTAAASPDAYVAALTGWQQALVKKLRAAVRKAKPADEVIKWGNIVYFANGPVTVIRAEDTRVLFGFWRGKRLVDLEPKLKPGGKYEMATMELREGDTLSPAKATKLMKAAIALNKTVGDPTKAAVKPKKPAAKRKKKSN
jgi:hypothetical protein